MAATVYGWTPWRSARAQVSIQFHTSMSGWGTPIGASAATTVAVATVTHTARRRHVGGPLAQTPIVTRAIAGCARYSTSYQPAPRGDGTANPTAAIADSARKTAVPGVGTDSRAVRRSARHARSEEHTSELQS